jgi:hypothetical protein
VAVPKPVCFGPHEVIVPAWNSGRLEPNAGYLDSAPNGTGFDAMTEHVQPGTYIGQADRFQSTKHMDVLGCHMNCVLILVFFRTYGATAQLSTSHVVGQRASIHPNQYAMSTIRRNKD